MGRKMESIIDKDERPGDRLEKEQMTGNEQKESKPRTSQGNGTVSILVPLAVLSISDNFIITDAAHKRIFPFCLLPGSYLLRLC